MITKGTPFPLYQPRDEWNESANATPTCQRTIRCLYDGWRDVAPVINEPHPEDSRYVLLTRHAKQLETNGLLCEITLDYGWLPGTVSDTDFATLPADVIDENGSAIEVPIFQHPSWDDSDVFDPEEKLWQVGDTVQEGGTPPASGVFIGFTPDSIWFGVSKYVVGSYQVSVTSYSFTPVKSDDGTVGTQAVPTGYAGDAENWLIMTSHAGRSGPFYTLTVVYQYSAIPAPTGLYPTS